MVITNSVIALNHVITYKRSPWEKPRNLYQLLCDHSASVSAQDLEFLRYDMTPRNLHHAHQPVRVDLERYYITEEKGQGIMTVVACLFGRSEVSLSLYRNIIQGLQEIYICSLVGGVCSSPDSSSEEKNDVMWSGRLLSNNVNKLFATMTITLKNRSSSSSYCS